MTITMTLEEILDQCRDWEKFCDLHGFSEWACNGGGDVQVSLTAQQAHHLGIMSLPRHKVEPIEKVYPDKYPPADPVDPKVEWFRGLSSREKWDKWKELDNEWCCEDCGTVMDDGPHSASPFPGAEVCCGECDSILTRRTGGGQSDPFYWKPGQKKEETSAFVQALAKMDKAAPYIPSPVHGLLGMPEVWQESRIYNTKGDRQ